MTNPIRTWFLGVSVRRKWLLSVVGLVAAGVVLEVAISFSLLLQGAAFGARTWLVSQYEQGQVRIDKTIRAGMRRSLSLLTKTPAIVDSVESGDPELVTKAMDTEWSWHQDHEFWLVRLPSGAVVTNLPACAGAPGFDAVETASGTREGDPVDGDLNTFCAGLPVMLERAAVGHGTLFLGTVVDEWYVDSVQAVAQVHATVIGPAGLVATSVLEEDGTRADLSALTERVRQVGTDVVFDKEAVYIGGHGYGGYPYGPGEVGKGAHELEAFVLIAPLDRTHPNAPGRLVLIVPARFLEQGSYYSLMSMVVVGTLIVLALMCVAWLLIVSFTKPLEILVDATQEVAGGDLDTRVPVVSGDEVGQLGAAFNSMVARLAETRDRLVQTEKMAAIGQLAGGVAHEINNPLGVIVGFAQGMESRIGPDDPMYLPVTAIAREAYRCRALVQELLTFSRTAATTVEMIEVNALVDSALLLLEAHPRNGEVSVVRDLRPGPLLVSGNITHLKQVLVNLGTNAVDASPSGGQVTFRTRFEDGVVYMDVIDTGTGVPSELRARIFEPFFTTKEPGKGTGLGLSLVYEIIRQHHGDVVVAETSSAGTTFTVTLPSTDAEIT